MRVMAIDPGTKGAIALFEPGGKPRLSVYQLPTVSLPRSGKTQSGKKKSSQTRLDLDACWSLILGLSASAEPEICFLEDVNGYGGNAFSTGASSFVLGSTCGALEMALVAAQVPRGKIAPSAWKKALKITGGTPAEKKTAARVAASKIFPEHADLFRRVKDDGVAEAALIAWFGATQILGYANARSDSKVP